MEHLEGGSIRRDRAVVETGENALTDLRAAPQPELAEKIVALAGGIGGDDREHTGADIVDGGFEILEGGSRKRRIDQI